jgi:hypothetical protein
MSDKKPREFWLDALDEKTISWLAEEPEVKVTWIHVIEHSAYAQLQKENEDLKNNCISLFLHEQRMAVLQKENAALRASLKEVIAALRRASGIIEFCYLKDAKVKVTDVEFCIDALAKIKAKGEL